MYKTHKQLQLGNEFSFEIDAHNIIKSTVFEYESELFIHTASLKLIIKCLKITIYMIISNNFKNKKNLTKFRYFGCECCNHSGRYSP